MLIAVFRKERFRFLILWVIQYKLDPKILVCLCKYRVGRALYERNWLAIDWEHHANLRLSLHTYPLLAGFIANRTIYAVI